MTQEQIEAVKAELRKVATDAALIPFVLVAAQDALATITALQARVDEAERERDEARAWHQASQEALADQLEARTKAEDQAEKFKWQVRDTCTRAEKAEAEVARLTKERDEALGTLRWAHETLYEINPSNYDHDEVTTLNDASVEVILGIAPLLGEKHGKTDAWWHSRIEGQRAQLAACQAESAACWKNLVEAGRQRDQARADLATLRAAIAEAVRRAEDANHAWCRKVVEPLRNPTKPLDDRALTASPVDDSETADAVIKPEAPSERIMSDKDRENPVEGAHPLTKPEADPLVEALEWYGEQARLARLIHSEGDAGRHALQDDGGKRARKALASRGLVRGEGVER